MSWNLLMRMAVIELLPGYPQVYIRNTGTTGLGAFEELYEAGKVPVCVELRTRVKGVPSPMHIPLCRRRDRNNYITLAAQILIPTTAVVVYHHRAMQKQGGTAGGWNDFGGPVLSRTRFVWDEALTDIPSSFPLAAPSRFIDVKLHGFESVTCIQDGFMALAAKMKHIDISSLTKVQIIQSQFLANCMKLQSLDLSPLSNVTSIGSEFMSGCETLAAIELSGLRNVTVIGDSFLQECSGIRSLSLKPLSKLTVVGSKFLQQCSNLKTIEMFPTTVDNNNKHDDDHAAPSTATTSTITEIGKDFLFLCYSLNSISLSSLSNLTCIPDNFLSVCEENLVEVDTSPLGNNVTTVGRCFLHRCNIFGVSICQA